VIPLLVLQEKTNAWRRLKMFSTADAKFKVRILSFVFNCETKKKLFDIWFKVF